MEIDRKGITGTKDLYDTFHSVKWRSEVDWTTCCNSWILDSISSKNSLDQFQLKNIDNQNYTNINLILQILLLCIGTNALFMVIFASNFNFCNITIVTMSLTWLIYTIKSISTSPYNINTIIVLLLLYVSFWSYQ